MTGLRRNQLIPFCLSVILLFTFNLLSAQDCNSTATNEAGDIITFNGVTYDETADGCTSTWSYCLTAGSGNPEISHFMIANNSCLACFDSSDDILDSSHPIQVGTDPTTGQCGIKFDFGLSVDEEVCFSFTLNGAFEVAERLFVTKAGQNINLIEICGPSCTETTCDNSNPPPPPPDEETEEEDPPTPEGDCPTIAYNEAGDEITFVGVTYNTLGDECSSTWSYCLKAGPGNPEISHFNIASPNCLACLDDENDILDASHPFEIGTDPTTGQCGIKFDFGLEVEEEICFSFTLKGSFAVSEQLFVTKAGQNVHTVPICGPSCTEVTCEDDDDMEELDCIDVVANRPVEDTYDHCGNWCNSAYTFTLGPGDCYVAGDDLYFTEYNNGTASLKGSVIQGSSIGYLDVLFTDRTTSAPSGSPKYMLCVDSGAEFWYYYESFTGTFTYPDGNTTEITRRGPSFQVGYGANVQDFEYGASGWFNTSNGDIGDMNFQLGNPEICEETDIYLEVECAEVGSLFETNEDTQASNGDYITVKPNNNAYNEAPESPESRVRFHVELSEAGSYFVFARVKAPSTYDDSFWVRVNNGTWVKWNEITPSSAFSWSQVHDNNNNNTPVSFFLEAGANTIDFAYREDGTELDKINISQSMIAPTGEGAEATNCICEDELVLNCNPTNENCDSNNTPGIDLEVSGATSTLSYLWSNGATTQDLTDIEAGTYTVTVSTANGCSATCSTVVEDFEPMSIECHATNATCISGENADPTGLVTVLVNGGTAPFSYQWSNGSTNPSIDGVEPGTYSVIVTDANGCIQSCSATVEVEASFNMLCTVINDYCNGNTNAAIYVEHTADPSTVSYLWSNGSTDQMIGGVGPGTYSVTITSNINGCSKTCSATVEPLEPLSIECEATNTTCGSTDDGTVTVHVTGGTEPYTIHWENGNCTDYANGLEVGQYPIMVTDANGCEVECIAIVEPSESLEVSCTPTIGDCNGNFGSIETAVIGGSGVYTYAWSNGNTSPNLFNVPTGTYTITVTDQDGCFGICEATIESTTPIELNCTPTTTSCTNNTGAIITEVSGGASPYTYQWNTGATSNNLSDIPAGTYTLTVTDNNGCVATCQATVEAASSPEITCVANNADCGLTNGFITTQITGGSAPFNYTWNNGATSANIDNLAEGTYMVVITDANGCTATCTAIVESDAPITASCEVTSNACDTQNGATISASVSGGNGNYTYLWSNGETTPSINNLSAGVYTLTVTDTNGCQATCETEVLTFAPLEINCAYMDFVCSSPNFANLSSTVSGGDGNYTFMWSNGSSNQNQEIVSAGSYSLTVTDGQGCSATCSVEIPDTDQLIAECITQHNACDASNNNSITTLVSGGLGEYTYLWSNGSTESNLQNVPAGTYSVTVTDMLGCLAVCQATIDNIISLEATCTSTNLDCTGENTGALSVSVSGGTAPYSYSWNNGGSSASLSNLPVGTYTVVVTDANGCTATCSSTVEEAEPIIVISSSTPLECFGDSTSSADFTISGGTGPYTYLWDNGSTEPVITNLSAGFYGITVTDANGCIGICGTWVEGPDAIEVLFENTDVSCFGGNDGTITSTVSGGSGVYSFLWDNGATTQNQTGLEAGVYSLTVSDENGCTQIFTATIESNNSLEASCTSTPLSCPDAQDGNILLDVNGGTGSYTFNWSNGATTQNQINLTAGTYTVTITDGNGCSTTCTSTIDTPTPLQLTCTPNDLICAGPQTGSITSELSGGVAPYTYQWDNGATTSSLENLNTGSYTLTVTDANGCTIVCTSSVETSLPLEVSIEGQDLLCGEANSGIAAAIVEGGTGPFTYAWSNNETTAQINNLNEGTYDLIVTDAKGCTASASITINAIPAISLVCETQDLLCGDANSGSINVSLSGGTAPFTYNWSNGATTQNINNAAAGNYTLSVTDANGCTATCSSTLIFIEPLTANCTATDLVCATSGTGAVDLSITGGTAPFIYIWSNGANSEDLNNLDAGTYSVTVMDANGCAAITTCDVNSDPVLEVTCTVVGATCGDDQSGDIEVEVAGGVAPYTYSWNNGATTEDLTDILSGTYTLTVTDANGCTTTCTSIVETSLGLNLSVTTEGTQCGEEGTGSVDLLVTGGTGNYTFSWSNGAISEDLTNVDAGSYTVTVTDNNGCSSVAVAIVDESTAMEAVCEPNNIPCGGEQTGSVDVTVIGGTGPYGFQWSNGSVAEDLNSVGAGTYTVTITDSNGCQTICSSTVTESPAFTLSCSADAVSCKNGNDGAVNVNIAGGTEPFTYEWSNGATSQNLNNLSAGTYIITATDANGCTATCTSIVSEPSFLIVVAQGNDISCNGQTDGSAFATVIGGTVPYTYAWSNGATTSFVNALAAGTYTLSVTDANGCSNFGVVTINEPEVLSVSCNATAQDCQTLFGSINTTVTGGTAPFTYTWSNGNSEANLGEAQPGSYSVTVTDARGCSTTCSADIASANPINLTCVATNESCGTPSLGSIDLTVSGGTGPYFYQWSNGIGTEDLVDIAAGMYSVTVTDIFGCSAVCASIVEAAPSIGIQLTTQDIACNGSATGSIQTSIGQGMPPFSYNWSNGATTANIDGLTAGTYTVTVIDANGCSSVANATLSQPSNILVVVSGNPVSCNGGNNGNAFATAIGGIPPYQYSWSNDATTSFINTLTSGIYTVTVTDANGCSAVGSTIVDEPAAITIDFETTQLTCGSDNNGAITAIITNGVAPLSYQWSTGATTASIDGLSAGTYGLIITDASGCSTSAFVDISAANPMMLTCSAEDVLCAGDTDGAASVSVTGGALPYSYAWSNGITTETVADLAAGVYTVTVTDANGCTAVCTSTVNEPQPLIADYGSTDVSCNGGNDGTLFASPSGGTAPYIYEWSTGDNTTTVENLPAGAYGLTLTDANGCIFICGIIISEPEAITCTTEVGPAISGTTDLFDITVTASGGTGNLSYSIDGGANYQNDNVFADLPAGTYPIVTQDENGCTSTCEATVGGGSGLSGEDGSDSRMAISPNPAESTLNLTYQTKDESLSYVEVKTLNGKVLYTEEIETRSGDNTITLDVSRYANGTYIMVIYSPNGITSEQFSVMR